MAEPNVTPAAGSPEAVAAQANTAREFLSGIVADPESVKTLDDAKAVEMYAKVKPKVEGLVKTQADARVQTETKTAVEAAIAKAKTEWETAGKQARSVPDSYTTTLPEKSFLDAEAVKRIHASAREAKLTNEETQRVLAAANDEVQQFWTAKEAAYKKVAEGWVNMVVVDKEIGGEHAEANIELSKRVVAKYGTKELVEMFKSTGMGNHPEFVRLMVRIGKTMSDDQLVVPGSESSAPAASMASKLYDHPSSKSAS